MHKVVQPRPKPYQLVIFRALRFTSKAYHNLYSYRRYLLTVPDWACD